MITNQPTSQQIKDWENALGRTIPPDCSWLCKETATICFFNYTQHDIELAISTKPGWATRQFITTCFMYTFNQLHAQRCTARIAASNLKSIKMVLKMGFVLEGVIRKALENEDCLIFGMLKKECRWIQNGQEKPTKRTRTSRRTGNDSRTG